MTTGAAATVNLGAALAGRDAGGGENENDKCENYGDFLTHLFPPLRLPVGRARAHLVCTALGECNFGASVLRNVSVWGSAALQDNDDSHAVIPKVTVIRHRQERHAAETPHA